MTIRELQRRAVDGIKRHALLMSLDSPRAQAHILTEYLWSEEGAETAALHRTTSPRSATPPWVDKLAANQLADEQRHAALLRERLVTLGARTDRTPPGLMRAKLWWVERATAPYMNAFDAGPVVVLLAIAAQLEGTGVRMFGRHLDVLELHRADDPTTAVLREILSDEKRHARSCAAAVERLVREEERPMLEELRERIAMIDRALGVTISVVFWLVIAAHAARDRVRARGAL
ncbi:MAG TPA: ferritin-like domain-containing protein [Kofleriaceae bacterium]|nr:ferritin-like domain-containing protein [Kofleriaceae bacterium]